jgi:hypothetical protein
MPVIVRPWIQSRNGWELHPQRSGIAFAVWNGRAISSASTGKPKPTYFTLKDCFGSWKNFSPAALCRCVPAAAGAHRKMPAILSTAGPSCSQTATRVAMLQLIPAAPPTRFRKMSRAKIPLSVGEFL